MPKTESNPIAIGTPAADFDLPDAFGNRHHLSDYADKPAVLAEAFRLLAPGGRLRVADVVADEPLTDDRRAELGTYASCAAGALSRSEYLDELARAGFADASVTFTVRKDDGVHPAVVRARKPETA